MGLFAGLFFGFLVGVGLVAGFQYVSDIRRKQRIQKVLGLHYSFCVEIWLAIRAALALCSRLMLMTYLEGMLESIASQFVIKLIPCARQLSFHFGNLLLNC